MKFPLRVLGALLLALGVAGWQPVVAAPAAAFPQAGGPQVKQGPLAEKEVVQLVKKNKKDLAKIAPEIQQRGVAFDMTPDIEKELRKAGADDAFVANVKNLGPTARAHAMVSQGGGLVGSPEEMQAFQAVQNELDPDRKLQMVNDFAQKYPNSKVLTYVYFLAEGAFLQKGDLNKVVEFGEKALQLKPDNLNALMMMATVLPQPQYLRNDPDPDKKLDEAEKDANAAIQQINQLQKAQNETDEQFQQRKNSYLASLHAALGLVHYQRAMEALTGPDKTELAKAETEYQASVTGVPDPAPENYFRLGEVETFQGKLNDAMQSFTKCAQLGAGTQLQQLAEQRIAELKQKMAGGAPKP